MTFHFPVCPVCTTTIGNYVKDNKIMVECLCDTPLSPKIIRDDKQFLIWLINIDNNQWKYRFDKGTDLLEVFYSDKQVTLIPGKND